MHLHILGICGTFMGSLALLARELGHTITGSDSRVYPPMSTLLAEAGIECLPYDPANLEKLKPDLVIVGNALSRGHREVEALLDLGLPYTSGPQWLFENVLQGKTVLAVAGTHGKTTTTALLAWILDQTGLEPGFLIGGVPKNFPVSARLGGGKFFVIEADEYDTAFFDKRAKFIHYRPKIAILNNLEYDHADIYPDLRTIQVQFHHLIRTVPQNGRLIVPQGDRALEEVLAMGCWTPVELFAIGQEAPWRIEPLSEDGRRFALYREGEKLGEGSWPLVGRHNLHNALAAIIAASHVGVDPKLALKALATFRGVRRRLERLAEVDGIVLYDDFAHHPTAIAETLRAARSLSPERRLIAVVEPRSNSMRLGVHSEKLPKALAEADLSFLYVPEALPWDPSPLEQAGISCWRQLDLLIEALLAQLRPGDRVVFMSNGAFAGLPRKVIKRLRA